MALRLSVVICVTSFLLGSQISHPCLHLASSSPHRSPLHPLDSRLAHSVEAPDQRREFLDRSIVLQHPHKKPSLLWLLCIRGGSAGRDHHPLEPARRRGRQPYVRRRQHLQVVSLYSRPCLLTTYSAHSPLRNRCARVHLLCAPQCVSSHAASKSRQLIAHTAHRCVLKFLHSTRACKHGRLPVRSAHADARARFLAPRVQCRTHGRTGPPGCPLVGRALGR